MSCEVRTFLNELPIAIAMFLIAFGFLLRLSAIDPVAPDSTDHITIRMAAAG